jgi:hypothetical protein
MLILMVVGMQQTGTRKKPDPLTTPPALKRTEAPSDKPRCRDASTTLGGPLTQVEECRDGKTDDSPESSR